MMSLKLQPPPLPPVLHPLRHESSHLKSQFSPLQASNPPSPTPTTQIPPPSLPPSHPLALQSLCVYSLLNPALNFFVSASPSSLSPPPPPPFFPPVPPPPAALLVPSDPTPTAARFSSDLARCSLSFSARSRYSVNFLRMSSLSLSFFSSVKREGGEGEKGG